MSYRVRPGNVSKFSSKTWNRVRTFSRLWFVMYFRSQQKTNHLNYYRKAEWTLFRAVKMFFPTAEKKKKSLTLAEGAGWQRGKFTSWPLHGAARSPTKSSIRAAPERKTSLGWGERAGANARLWHQTAHVRDTSAWPAGEGWAKKMQIEAALHPASAVEL